MPIVIAERGLFNNMCWSRRWSSLSRPSPRHLLTPDILLWPRCTHCRYG